MQLAQTFVFAISPLELRLQQIRRLELLLDFHVRLADDVGGHIVCRSAEFAVSASPAESEERAQVSSPCDFHVKSTAGQESELHVK